MGDRSPLPIRDDENVFVVFAASPNLSTHERHLAAVAPAARDGISEIFGRQLKGRAGKVDPFGNGGLSHTVKRVIARGRTMYALAIIALGVAAALCGGSWALAADSMRPSHA